MSRKKYTAKKKFAKNPDTGAAVAARSSSVSFPMVLAKPELGHLLSSKIS